MIAGSVTSPMTRNVPPHKGHTVTSNSNARLRRWAQVSREDSVDWSWFGRLDGLEASGLWARGLCDLPGTTRALNLLFGANRGSGRLRSRCWMAGAESGVNGTWVNSSEVVPKDPYRAVSADVAQKVV